MAKNSQILCLRLAVSQPIRNENCLPLSWREIQFSTSSSLTFKQTRRYSCVSQPDWGLSPIGVGDICKYSSIFLFCKQQTLILHFNELSIHLQNTYELSIFLQYYTIVINLRSFPSRSFLLFHAIHLPCIFCN